MKFYYVDTKYVNFLREVDTKVLDNKDNYFQRPYVGVITSINNIDYLIPLTSPRGRFSRNKPQYHRIMDGVNLIAVLKFNNMIPVKRNVIHEIIFDVVSDNTYKILLQKEYFFIKRNAETISSKAKKYLETIWNSTDFYLKISNNFHTLIIAMNNYV